MKYEIGQKIRRFRELRGLSQKEFALKIGVSNSRVSNWEQGINRPDADILSDICKVLRVSADELLDTKQQKNLPQNDSIGAFSLPDILPIPRTVKKPLLGEIACGEPILCDKNIDGEIDVPENMHCDFVLRCKGDSMIGARIHDGDVVYIRMQAQVENGEIAAVLLDGTETTLKRFYQTNNGIVLQAENPAYTPISVALDRQFSVLGKAVGFTSLIR